MHSLQTIHLQKQYCCSKSGQLATLAMKKPNLVNNNNNDELINVSNKLTDNLEPRRKLEKEGSSWEETLIMNLNSMDDDRKTSYVKYRLS